MLSPLLVFFGGWTISFLHTFKGNNDLKTNRAFFIKIKTLAVQHYTPNVNVLFLRDSTTKGLH